MSETAAEYVNVPAGQVIHLAVDDDVSACERGGKDWTGSGDFYLTDPDSPYANQVNCQDCLEWRHA